MNTLKTTKSYTLFKWYVYELHLKKQNKTKDPPQRKHLRLESTHYFSRIIFFYFLENRLIYKLNYCSEFEYYMLISNHINPNSMLIFQAKISNYPHDILQIPQYLSHNYFIYIYVKFVYTYIYYSHCSSTDGIMFY